MLLCRRAGLAAVVSLAGASAVGGLRSGPPSMAAAPPAPVAVVTGGSRGIGAACCRQLAARGYGVVVAYRSDDASAASVSEEIAACGGRAVTVRADVSREEDVVRLFEVPAARPLLSPCRLSLAAVLAHPTADTSLTAAPTSYTQVADTAFGPSSRLAVLVNNAGVLGPAGSLQEVATADQLRAVCDTNVVGPLLCCREAERRMSTKHGGQGGSIVQVSSGSAYIGSPLLYAASKGALNSLTIGLVRASALTASALTASALAAALTALTAQPPPSSPPLPHPPTPPPTPPPPSSAPGAGPPARRGRRADQHGLSRHDRHRPGG